MNTIIYNENKAKDIENAVMAEFKCTISEIVGFADTSAKKVVVFILFKFMNFEKRNIAHAYNMTYLFVPTVASDLDNRFLVDPLFRTKVINVLNAVNFTFDVNSLLNIA